MEKKKSRGKIRLILLISIFLVASLFSLYFVKDYIGYAALLARGGEITQITIEQPSATIVWQGFFGLGLMVRGFDVLQDEKARQGQIDSRHFIFDCLEPNIEHEIYASSTRPDLLDYSSVRAVDPSAVDMIFNIPPSSMDSSARTFARKGSVMFGRQNITNVSIAYTKKYGLSNSAAFEMGVLNISGELVFFTKIAGIQYGFNNNLLNYQILLPAPNVTTYYIFTDPNDKCPEGLGIGVFGDGYVSGVARDNATGVLLQNVRISVSKDSNITDVDGSYNITTSVGYQYLTAEKAGYDLYAAPVNITLLAEYMHNISLIPSKPVKYNSTIKGYVRDNVTNQVLQNVTVKVGGRKFQTNSAGYYNDTAAEGASVIVGTKDQYATYVNRVTLVRFETHFHNISMQPLYGQLQGIALDDGMQSPVPDVQIRITDQEGQTNSSGEFNLSVHAGDHLLVAVAQGYENYVTNVTIMPSLTTIISISLVPDPKAGKNQIQNGTISGFARSSLTSSPIENVSVSIGGSSKLSNQDGSYNISAFAGRYVLAAINEGYENYLADIKVSTNEITYHAITMNPFAATASANGTLHGRVSDEDGIAIEDALVSVAGQLVESNASGGYAMNVSSGIHSLVAAASGYDNYVTGVVIAPGNATMHNIIMKSLLGARLGALTGRPSPAEIAEREINHKVSVASIVKKLRKGAFLNVPIIITNYLNSSISIQLSIEGEANAVAKLDKSSLTVNQESGTEFIVALFGRVEPGAYEGTLKISGDIKEEIPMRIIVYEEDKLPIEALLLELSILDNSLVTGDALRYRIDLQNLLQEETYDIILSYSIMDKESGDEKFIGSDDARVQTAFSILKSYPLSKNYTAGDYLLKVEAKYLDLHVSQDKPFRITEPIYRYSVFGVIRLWTLLLLILAAGMTTAAYMVYKKRKAAKQRYKIDINDDALPQRRRSQCIRR